jgi:hypothetical protein
MPSKAILYFDLRGLLINMVLQDQSRKSYALEVLSWHRQEFCTEGNRAWFDKLESDISQLFNQPTE